MGIFGKKKVELDEEQLAELEERIMSKKKIHDLNPGNIKKRKEPVKPWGKKERFWVLFILLATVLTSIGLALRASGSLKIPRLNFNLGDFWQEEAIVIGKKTEAQKAKEQFGEKAKNLAGTYAFYVVDLGTGVSYGINENRVMQAASLIKLPLMLFVSGRVDEAKIEAMGKRSDNNVFRELVAKFGRETIQDYIYNLGMKNTSLAQNETTPKEIGDLLVKIYQDKNEKILRFLTDTVFEDWLKKGVPANVRVAHKYGREVGVVNDAGVIYAPRPFVLVIMTQKVVETEADATISQLTSMIYSIHAED